MAGIQGNIIVSTTEANVTVSEDTTAITVTEETTNVTLVAGSVFFPYDQILRDMIPGSNGVISLGNTSRYWDHLYVESITASNTVVIGGNTTIGGDANISGSLTGPISDGYGVVSSGTLRGFNYLDVIPTSGDAYDLGNTTNRWDQLHVRELHAGFYEGRNLNPASGDANNPSMANALVLNTNSLMHRGNAIYMDSDHGSQDSDEKTVIGSGGAEGDISGVVNGIMFDNAANSISIGKGIDLQNPEDSQVNKGLKIDIANSNISALASNLIIGNDAYAASFKAGTTVMNTSGFAGDGSLLTNLPAGNITGLNTDDVTEAGQLYYTTARANSAINDYTGTFTNVGDVTSSGTVTSFNNLVVQNGGVQADSGTSTFATANVASRLNIDGNINMQNGQIDATGNINSGPLYVTGDSTIVGNLQVSGNIDYVNVEDLLINDNTITLNYGNASARDAFIYVDRSGSGSTNAHIKWSETDDDWEFFDGTTSYNMPKSTTDLAEGTNLYYTDARFDTRFATKDTDDLTEGTTNKYYATSLFNTDFATKTTSDLTEGTNLYYTDGRFDTRLATKSTTDLAEGTNLYYTNARANAAFVDSLDNITTAIVSDSNITTTANISADNVLTDVVESATSVTLYGKGTGVELDKAIDTTDVSTIVNLDTTGYSLADATTPADFTVGDHTPTLLISVTTTAGNNIATCNDIFAGGLAGFGKQVPALRGPGFSTATGGGGDGIVLAPTTGGAANVEHAMTTAGDSLFLFGGVVNILQNGIANTSAGLYGTGKGWSVFNTATQSAEDVFPLQAYTTGVSGGEITFSEDAIATGTTTLLFQPGMAQTSSSNVQLKYYSKNITSAGGNAEPTGLYGRMSTFDQPETLANVTFDAISYGNVSSVTMSSVNTKNIADFEGQAESAARFPRGLLIGPSTSPDAFSGRTGLNDSSALGVILENDGETYTGNNAPAAKFLINSYSGNLDDLTYYPNWGTQGATGNITLDLPQIKAPQLQIKSFRGAKSTANASSYVLQAGDVVGKVVFSPGQTTGLGFQGADLYNPPSAITVDVGDADITTVANTYMHLTTTPDPGTNLGYMRNNANISSGANQQTNFTTKAGNVTIAAKVDGKITLAPTPDYGDAANSTVWTRFAGSTHEYHTYLDAEFLDSGTKSGTLVTIQPKSGTTTGSGGLGYDSKGNATLRFQTHNADSSARYNFDLIHDEANEKFFIGSGVSGQQHIEIESAGRVSMKQVMRLHNLTTTEINALSGPLAGDTVFNTTLGLICVYDGSSWQKINSSAMGS